MVEREGGDPSKFSNCKLLIAQPRLCAAGRDDSNLALPWPPELGRSRHDDALRDTARLTAANSVLFLFPQEAQMR